jgi:hypothetical protein
MTPLLQPSSSRRHVLQDPIVFRISAGLALVMFASCARQARPHVEQSTSSLDREYVARDLEAPPVADPRRAAYMPPQNLQMQRSIRPPRPLTAESSMPSRFQIGVQPLFASLHLPMENRPVPARGFGIAAQGDWHLHRGLYLSLFAQRSIHPLREIASVNAEDQSVTVLAPSGNLTADGLGIGIHYLVDFGRVTPTLDVGGGAIWFVGPHGEAKGQRGNECRRDNQCDPGLRCRNDRCEIYPFGSVHFGLGFDVRLARYWSLGMDFRYFAPWRTPAKMPVYLTTGLRGRFRF